MLTNIQQVKSFLSIEIFIVITLYFCHGTYS